MITIKEEFWFYKKNDVLEVNVGIESCLIHEAVSTVEEVVDWANTKFGKRYGDVVVNVTDIPIVNTPAFMGIEELSKEVMIYLNITELLKSFLDGHYMDDYLFPESKSCKEYVAFVLLHEIGHIVDAMEKTDTSSSFVERVEKYIESVQGEYKVFESENFAALEKKRVGNINKEDAAKLKKNYRDIPSEKIADSFAEQYAVFFK